MACIICGRKDGSFEKIEGQTYCFDCAKKKRTDAILARGENIRHASDFKDWSMRDMSELFWQHLGKYIKEPNEDSILLVERAFDWAVHADKALANSFLHALEWAGIDLYAELDKYAGNPAPPPDDTAQEPAGSFLPEHRLGGVAKG